MIETPSDRNFACIACSGFYTKDIESCCPECGSPIDIGLNFVGQTVGGYDLTDYIGRGFYGLTYKCKNRAGIDFAIKIIPEKIYKKQDKDFDSEIDKYTALRNHPNIARLEDKGKDIIQFGESEIPCYFLVMEWIEGKTLRSFLEKEKITATDVFSICTEIASALDRFEGANLCHNDLNADNIMVVELEIDELGIRYTSSRVQIKIIDTGSAIFQDERHHSKISDLNFLGLHIAKMIDAVKQTRHLPLEQQAFLETLERYVGRLRDENASRGFTTARDFIQRLRDAYDRKERYEIEANETLRTPFEYLNALDFGDNSTLVGRLFHDDFPWVRESIMAPSQQVLVTGPRGCGKTMILKNLRFRTRLLATSDEPTPESFIQVADRSDFIGLFVSARVEFGNNLFTEKLPAWAQEEDNTICFFQLLYALEALETLVLIKTHFGVEFDLRAELNFCDLINNAINQNARSLNEALSDVRTCILKIRMCEFEHKDADVLTGGGFLRRLCSVFLNLHPSFKGKKINFLLDDFSKPKVPASIQKSLLPLIWAPGEGYFFKVSAHSKSTEKSDSRGNQYDAHRDFSEVNLGKEFISYTNTKSGQESIDKTLTSILSRRFMLSAQNSGSFVEPKTVLGPGPDSIAEELTKAQEAGTSYQYRGWKTIQALCSGEISFVIDVFGRLFESHDKHASYPISATIQNRVIKELSKNELRSLQYLPQVHTNLFEIAQAFGVLSRHKLISKKVKDGKNSRYAEYTRMEVDLKKQNAKASDAMDELISSGVFIDGGYSSSSSATPTQRLLFRKIFTPAFPTTWANRDGFNWTQERFLEFSLDPLGFVKELTKKDSDDIDPGPLFEKTSV